MIEKLLTLFERLVVAVEAIASGTGTSQIEAPEPAPAATAPAATAPAATAPAATAPAATSEGENPFLNPDLELDKEGHYFDEEIGTTGNDRMKADGVWKLKRGVSKELVAAKYAEQDRLRMLARGEDVPAATEPAPAAAPAATPPPPATTEAAATPPPPATNAITEVRLPAHKDSNQFTRDELVVALEDCAAIYGEAFESAYNDWLAQSNRVGMAYTELDDGAITWFAWQVLDFVSNN